MKNIADCAPSIWSFLGSTYHKNSNVFTNCKDNWSNRSFRKFIFSWPVTNQITQFISTSNSKDCRSFSCVTNWQICYPLKKCSIFTRKHPWQSKNFIEITLWHGCSAVNLLHIFRTPFPKNTSNRLLLISLWLFSSQL